LHSNLALAVNAEYTYMLVKFEGMNHEYILLNDRINDVLGKLNIKNYTVLNSFKGSELEGINYKPLFEDFIEYKEKKGAFKVFCAKFVTNEDGTGIVHIAPAFGESDFELGIEKGLIDIDRPLCPIDENGFFTNDVKMVQNKHFKEADKIIIDTLKSIGRLIFNGVITHKYPLCYRTDTPLMYRVYK